MILWWFVTGCKLTYKLLKLQEFVGYRLLILGKQLMVVLVCSPWKGTPCQEENVTKFHQLLLPCLGLNQWQMLPPGFIVPKRFLLYIHVHCLTWIYNIKINIVHSPDKLTDWEWRSILTQKYCYTRDSSFSGHMQISLLSLCCLLDVLATCDRKLSGATVFSVVINLGECISIYAVNVCGIAMCVF